MWAVRVQGRPRLCRGGIRVPSVNELLVADARAVTVEWDPAAQSLPLTRSRPKAVFGRGRQGLLSRHGSEWAEAKGEGGMAREGLEEGRGALRGRGEQG